jgi:hypothetical protein
MCALIGQALEGTVKPSAEFTSNNVIKLPKVGTFGWTKYAHRRNSSARSGASQSEGHVR